MGQKSRIHQHLEKPLIWRDGPEGLYPFPLFWMEGKKDLEGFSGSLCLTFVKEPCQFHPVEGMLIHPYDEVLVFASANVKDMLDLGADVSIEIGEERETYTFSETQVVCIPRGTPHGPVKVSNVRKPFLHYVISLDPVYAAEQIPADALKAPVLGSQKYKDYCRVFKWVVDPVTGLRIQDKYANPEESLAVQKSNLDARGVSHPRNKGDKGPGNAENIVWLFGSEMLGFELNTLWGHYTDPGIWHRAGESHSHPTEEVLVYIGLDAEDPLNLGACCETALGEEDERYVCTTPTAYVQPKGFSHLPQITRWVDRPFGFLVIDLDSTHDSPWKDRNGSKTLYES
ncbi:hypothetical protein SAMN02745823_02059 [Sporobacter termitidis DSM 10068]|uniref:Cupin domain-containing protein n=1 Tax=Sporobacter termitidis DSM 10068 TaxID=1123282 RepID=A0A1M5XUW2_9FIRM|nr:hypothetical protein [Sporobacter termitidis]SHI03587.1 hypothetical protein SAMN02745823_02059 [Sporobacter termitidis DSM 10068]